MLSVLISHKIFINLPFVACNCIFQTIFTRLRFHLLPTAWFVNPCLLTCYFLYIFQTIHTRHLVHCYIPPPFISCQSQTRVPHQRHRHHHLSDRKIKKVDTLVGTGCIWASTGENLSSGVCEQQRPRPACTFAQSDQRLCYLPIKSIIHVSRLALA